MRQVEQNHPSVSLRQAVPKQNSHFSHIQRGASHGAVPQSYRRCEVPTRCSRTVNRAMCNGSCSSLSVAEFENDYSDADGHACKTRSLGNFIFLILGSE